jgi:UDP-N-acetylmuramate dehydrogenase
MAPRLLRELKENVPLGPLTTLGVGGEARFFIDAHDQETVGEALEWAAENGCKVTILGGGSNLLVSDRGVGGLVLRVRIRGVKELAAAAGAGGIAVFEVGAGEQLDEFVANSVAAGFAGVECLSGIPGYVGAAPIQNVGAYGQEIGETIVTVRVMHRTTRQTAVFDNPSCRFSYRNSVFKEELRDQLVVLTVAVALSLHGAPRVRYPDLVRELTSRSADPSSLSDVRTAVLAIRRSKGMLIDGSATDQKSAGSFFVNPVVTEDEADAIETRAQSGSGHGPPMPRFRAGEKVKLSAAWLIEQAGFAKGTGQGPVGISENHALAIVNRGGASATEVLTFASRVHAAVRARFGVALAPEPVLVGFTDEEIATLTLACRG